MTWSRIYDSLIDEDEKVINQVKLYKCILLENVIFSPSGSKTRGGEKVDHAILQEYERRILIGVVFHAGKRPSLRPELERRLAAARPQSCLILPSYQFLGKIRVSGIHRKVSGI
jgi:hypothetical protein